MGHIVPSVDVAVLADVQRLAAARRARRVLPGLPMPLNAIARLAARTLGAPMAIVAIMDVEEEHFVGSYGLPPPLDTQEPVPVAYSLCKYIVSADHPVIVDDMTADPNLAGHALAVEHGARAFAGVPLRDAADHTIGSLLVVDTALHAFTDADVTLLVEISALLSGPATDADHLDAAVVEDPDSAAVLDVTGQREAEHDAGVQRGFLHALLDSLDTGVISVDGAGRPVVFNRALRRMYDIEDNWTTDQLFGIFAECVRRPDGEPLPLKASPLSRALRGETIRDHEILIRIPDEGDHLFLGNAQPIDGTDGHRLGAVLALHEITGRRRAELRGEQLSLELDRSRKDFLTLVGHEMRTPLTSISASIEMLLAETGPPAPTEEAGHLMRGIARNTASLCDIVDGLLDLAGLETGLQTLAARPVDLAEIAQQAVAHAESAAAGNSITLTARIATGLITVGDPFRLRQALDHLLSNAVKYSRGGDRVRLTLHHDEHLITIAVADTGIGIPPDERDVLFERFYRATNVRHQGIPGTGLGLPLVRAIVLAHHGTVTLSHPASVGTTVTVRLPRAAVSPGR
jgi:two-component system, OmpR family, phosphate regulon sensor histidine kinase PhoR